MESRAAGWPALAALLGTTGVLHFTAPAAFASIVPRALGDPRPWVAWSGAAELACAPDRDHLPATVQDVLLARTARLGRAAGQIVQVAAVTGRPVTHEFLAAASGLSGPSLLAALHEVVASGLFVVDPSDGEGEAGRRACALRELNEEAGIVLPPEEELVLFSRWVTPEIVSRRFDAWFFLALAPAHTPPRPDGNETVDARWFEPSAALAASERGELLLAFPTLNQLKQLSAFATSEEVLVAHRGASVDEVTPRVVGEGAERRVVLPGEPGYGD